MPRLIALLAALFLFLAPSVQAFPWQGLSWTSIAEKVTRSLVRVTGTFEWGGEYTCTGFSIDDRAALYLTAAHCVGDAMTVDGHPILILFHDAENDYAVLQSQERAYRKPPLHLAKTPPRQGDAAAAFGYGYALDTPLFRAGHVSNPSVDLRRFNLDGLWLLLDTAYIGGMSGGPTVDREGRVIGVNQRSNEYMAVTRTFAVLLARVGSYFKK